VYGVKSPAHVNIPNSGWYIFGGDNTDLLRAQKMNTLSTEQFDTSGPYLYNRKRDDNQCLVQVYFMLINLYKINLVKLLFSNAMF